MSNTNTSTWEVFNFSDVFCFKRGKRYKKEDHTSGEIPYISSTKFNNGIDVYVSPPEYMDIHQNAITLNNSGSIGYCFYHPYRFVASDHCTIIDIHKKYNQKLNVYIALFLKPIIEKLKFRYGFAGEMSDERLKKENIKLPANSQRNPNWEYMGDYIKEKSESILYNNKNMAHKANSKKLLDTSKWKEFYLSDNRLFKIIGSKSITKTDINSYPKGDYPYITTSSQNNGIEGFYDDWTEEGNILTIDSVTVGSCFYQDENFLASDHVEKLIPYFKMNKYAALFLITIIGLEKTRYGYGRKFSQIRIKNTKIKLPVHKDGNPDWQFIENYVKTLSYSSNL